MSVKNAQTAEFLRNAFGGESMAHMRYLVWADHAINNGYPNIGKLYQAIAHAEQIHAQNHFNVLKNMTGGFKVDSGGEFGLKSVPENLAWAIEGELGEVNQLYPAYLAVAELQGEKNAVRTFRYALEAEKIHVGMFGQARDYALKEKDMPLGEDKIYICQVCGFTHIGVSPSCCPVCQVKSDLFSAF